MRGDKTIGVGQKRAEAGVGAKVNGAPAIFSLRKKFGVGMEDPSAQCDEGGADGLFSFCGFGGHDGWILIGFPLVAGWKV